MVVVWTAALAALCGLLGGDQAGAGQGAETAAEAQAFIDRAEQELLQLNVEASRAGWVQSTYITDDTEILSAKANERLIARAVELVKQAGRFDALDLPAALRRRFHLLKLSLTPLPAPADPAQTAELARIASSLEGTYGKGKYCPKDSDQCLDVQQLSQILATSRNPQQLLDAWVGWRTISPPMRPDYIRFVELANQGARELGYADLGVLWRSNYDMSPEAFAAELDRLWAQVRPLYDSLHAYVRWKLAQTYGTELVPPTGPIPAHLLGNMWAQSWANIYPLVAPPSADPGYDLTERLRARGLDPREMVRYGERFFLSLGFDPLPETFWQRSLFTKPRDRDVVCHASAWDIDLESDVRLKMCIEITAEDFSTVHHELGHNFYQRAYSHQPVLFRDSANDGFHEAVGDTLALSVTPKYLVELGLLDQEPDSSKDIGLLLQMALDKVAFLPFGLLIDQWRWKVFSGEVSPQQYNQVWWELRNKYQGIAPPAPRSEADFDPGAKYHVPANTPYARYFLATILQFQFHRALCQQSGFQGALNRCSIYNGKVAGARLQAMLEMGKSRPWPEALEALTGQREMDASALLDYFAPLKQWLDQQNQGKPIGW